MGMFTLGAKLYLSSRNRKIDNFRKNPIDLQTKILRKLLLFSKNTSYGIKYRFNNHLYFFYYVSIYFIKNFLGIQKVKSRK